jgi:hypothetical protein
VVGAAIGNLSWSAFHCADHPLGMSTAFENIVAIGFRGALGQEREGHSRRGNLKT